MYYIGNWACQQIDNDYQISIPSTVKTESGPNTSRKIHFVAWASHSHSSTEGTHIPIIKGDFSIKW